MGLSDRITPDVEAAPWVVDKIRELESLLFICKREIRRLELSGSNGPNGHDGNGTWLYFTTTPPESLDELEAKITAILGSNK